MSDMGKMRGAQRRAAKEGPKPQATELTPLELAIERKMRELKRQQATPDVDAQAIAKLVVKHWGDDALRVLRMALERARDELGEDPSKPAPGGPRGRGEGEAP